jgi:2-keto-3-deoxy-L-rhamnonate aldolase RhmA
VRFFLITKSPALARFAVANGVDRIFVDLELMGKVERQGHLNTVISRHSLSDVVAVREAVPDTELMVRLNPVHAGSAAEIDDAIASGADILMLPMYRSVAEVENFGRMIDGRCRLCILAETKEAMREIGACAALPQVDEVHIGLNDLSLDLGHAFMFSPLAMGLIDVMAEQLVRVGKPFGIGGLARVDEGLLPARRLIGEHVRLGSSAAILSRTFHRQLETEAEIRADMDFGREVELLRQCERDFIAAGPVALEANRVEAWRIIREIEASRGNAAGSVSVVR